MKDKPAFPQTIPNLAHEQALVGGAFGSQATISHYGMTLREWYAGMALQGFMANKDRPTTLHAKDDAEWCFTIADAMISQTNDS